nr:hypothetical protein [Consotaella salsifontis]
MTARKRIASPPTTPRRQPRAGALSKASDISRRAITVPMTVAKAAMAMNLLQHLSEEILDLGFNPFRRNSGSRHLARHVICQSPPICSRTSVSRTFEHLGSAPNFGDPIFSRERDDLAFRLLPLEERKIAVRRSHGVPPENIERTPF